MNNYYILINLNIINYRQLPYALTVPISRHRAVNGCTMAHNYDSVPVFYDGLLYKNRHCLVCNVPEIDASLIIDTELEVILEVIPV